MNCLFNKCNRKWNMDYHNELNCLATQLLLRSPNISTGANTSFFKISLHEQTPLPSLSELSRESYRNQKERRHCIHCVHCHKQLCQRYTSYRNRPARWTAWPLYIVTPSFPVYVSGTLFTVVHHMDPLLTHSSAHWATEQRSWNIDHNKMCF